MASGAMSFRRWTAAFDEYTKLAEPPWDQKNRQLFFSAGKMRGRKPSTKRGHRPVLFELQGKDPLFDIVSEHHKLSDYGKYRYQVYAHGRCGWSRRIHELAFMKAVVFVEASPCNEYLLAGFEPGVDYVPVAEDFSDLAEQVAKMDAQPLAAAAMAAKWAAKGRLIFAPECVLE